MGSSIMSFKDMGDQNNASLLRAFNTGVSSYFQTKTAKLQANTQAYQAEGQAKIAGYSADTIRANKAVQDVANRQQLEAMGRQISAQTAAYRDVQAGNTAQSGAANVDISSGSAAAVAEGNARRYADGMASSRRAYDLQQWQGESALAMLEAQAKGYGYQQQAYDATASAYRSVAALQGSAWGNALSSALVSLGTDMLTGKYGGQAESGKQQGKFYDRALQTYTSTPVRH